MNKIMVMLAALCGAVAVQAASFDWGATIQSSQNTSDFDGTTGWAQEGTQMYLVALGVSDFSGDLSGAATIADVIAALNGTTVASDTVSAGDYGGGYFERNYSIAAASINQWYAVVAYDPTTSKYYGYFTFEVSGLTDVSPAPNVTEIMDVSEYALVPEPTSLALLALGVAALGLRRKVK